MKYILKIQQNWFPRILVLFVFLFMSQLFAGATADKLDEYFKKCYKNRQFNGNVLVAINGQVIYHKSFGISNIDPERPLKLNSQFRLASLSKPITAMAVTILKERGLLKYDDELIKYIPELPYPGITIRHLLTHTSGIPKYEDLTKKYWDLEHEKFTEKKYVTNDDIIALLVEHHPDVLFNNGDKYSYSNTGYVLLASVVSRVSGEPFEKFLKDNIFKPSGMDHSLVYSAVRNDKMENRVYGYRLAMNGIDYISNDFHYMSGLAGDGAVYSTTADLFKWDRVLYTEKLVSKSSLDEAFSPAVLNDGSSTKYGLGWGIGKSYSGKKTVNHGGGWIASRTFLLREIEEDNTVVILTNHSSRHIYNIRKAVSQIIHNQPFEVSKIGISNIIGKEVVNKGIDEAISSYKHLKKTELEKYNFDKWELNSLGYDLIEIDMLPEAIKIFQLNLQHFPDFARGYNNLADSYILAGNKKLAIENYNKTLDIDPDNWYAAKKLKLILNN